MLSQSASISTTLSLIPAVAILSKYPALGAIRAHFVQPVLDAIEFMDACPVDGPFLMVSHTKSTNTAWRASSQESAIDCGGDEWCARENDAKFSFPQLDHTAAQWLRDRGDTPFAHFLSLY
ncbi:hypothetical protein BDN70DRAFT_940059 [Pholiota conissans]|uniref:Uncharacterized protein n=1 Tax=Pholiota conissans TaxID=109636 RepID=A0A9P6CS01_9AGAR|nr:hypothetical protein BDN70DRAFT_940059 [Pholiota conissans]